MKIPTLTPNEDPILRKVDRMIKIMISIMFASFILLVCCSCSSTKVATQVVEHTSIDTVYLSNVQYDSIYIYKDHMSEHHIGTMDFDTSTEVGRDKPIRTDTLYIKDKSIEYRYKMLRDTILKTQVDSIPYQVTIVETKEIQRPLKWYDHLARAILWLNVGFILFLAIRLFQKFYKP